MEVITIHIDAETKRQLEQEAIAQGISLDEYIAETLRRAVHKGWTDTVRRLAGAWGDDFPEPEELRQSLERESPRESA
jgi:hypothetical protein